MLMILQLITLFLIAVTMACTVGHALELPGKMRLTKDAYLTVQPIYYPGFAIAGFAEIGALPMTFALLFFTPRETTAFTLTLWSLVALLTVQIVFWIVTQPVNKFWLANQGLQGASATFFGTRRGEPDAQSSDWTALRNRWEYSHVARAVAASAALMLLATAIAVD
ncbi:MAG: DUF1772 domain-containing protein [Steroidobacter sp.]